MKDLYRDPKSDPEAKEHRERSTAFNRKKKTKQWCKGKVGREHVTEIVFDTRYSQPCRQIKQIWWGREEKFFWICHHIEQCTVCGKHVRWRVEKSECPDYRQLRRTFEGHGDLK